MSMMIQGQGNFQLPPLRQLLQQGSPVRQPGQLIEGSQLVEGGASVVQPVGGEPERQQGAGQQADQHQLVVAGACC